MVSQLSLLFKFIFKTPAILVLKLLHHQPAYTNQFIKESSYPYNINTRRPDSVEYAFSLPQIILFAFQIEYFTSDYKSLAGLFISVSLCCQPMAELLEIPAVLAFAIPVQPITQAKIHIGMQYKGDHLSFLPKRINDKIIFTAMMTRAASQPGQSFKMLIEFMLLEKKSNVF